MDAENIEEILPHFEFDSEKKARTIHEIAKKHNIVFSHDDYKNDIIVTRNDLAHSKSVLKRGKEVLETKISGTVTFSESKFVAIRQNIVKYHEIFDKLLEAVKIA